MILSLPRTRSLRNLPLTGVPSPMQETSSSKNLALAIVLCLAVLFGWSFFAEYMGWVTKPDPEVVAQQQAEAERARQEQAEADKARTSVPLTVFAPVPGRDITIPTPLYLRQEKSGTIEMVANSAEDVTIPAGANITLNIAENVTLTNKSGHTITNNGTLTVNGFLTNPSNLTNHGTITGLTTGA